MASFWEDLDEGLWEEEEEMEQEEEFPEEEYEDEGMDIALEEEEEEEAPRRRASYDSSEEFSASPSFKYENVNVNEKAKQAYEYYLSKGLSKNAAAGIVGNLMQESGMNPNASGDGGKAFGLAQWHPDRRKKMKDTSFYGQLDYVLNEQGESKRMLDAVNNASSPEEAAYLFGKIYERPGTPNWSKRQSYAKKLAEMQFGGQSYNPNVNPLAMGQGLLGENLQIQNLYEEEIPENSDFNFGFVQNLPDIYGDVSGYLKKKVSDIGQGVSQGIDFANDYLSDIETMNNRKRMNKLMNKPRMVNPRIVNENPIYT